MVLRRAGPEKREPARGEEAGGPMLGGVAPRPWPLETERRVPGPVRVADGDAERRACGATMPAGTKCAGRGWTGWLCCVEVAGIAGGDAITVEVAGEMVAAGTEP